MAEKRRQTFERFSTFTLPAKVAVVLFLLVGVFGIVYGFRGFFFQLEKPFFAQLNYSGPTYLSREERESQEIERQKKEDTDKDGVNDYDELYIFETSPYLVDTDSDGVGDAEEIRLGKNPTCPEGEDCSRAFASAEEVGPGPDILGGLSATEPTLDLDFGSLTSTEELKAKIQRTSSADLRRMLLGTGVDPLIVEKLTDVQIRELFDKAAEDSKQSGIIDQLLTQQQTVAAEEAAEGSVEEP